MSFLFFHIYQVKIKSCTSDVSFKLVANQLLIKTQSPDLAGPELKDDDG